MSDGFAFLQLTKVERLETEKDLLLTELKRWEKFAADNQWTDEDCTWLPTTRAAIAAAEGAK
jgi:hypothetical protein